MNPVAPDALLNSDHVRRRFERAAATFERADFVHSATRDGLLQRIDPLRLSAETVVDLGAATGGATAALLKRFPRSQLIQVDFAHAMLQKGRDHLSWWSKLTGRGPAFVQATAESLPLKSASVDVVFCNLMLPWISDPTPVLTEVSRILKRGGVFAFATFGPDSLQELARAWRQVDDTFHVNRFPDMHDLGDGLVRSGFSDPVLDVDRLAVAYTTPDKLFADLTHAGARNSLSYRRKTVTGKAHWRALLDQLQADAVDGGITLDLELVYGHAWGAGPRQDATHFEIDAATIGRRQR